MKKFNKDKYLRRLKLKSMFYNNSRKIYIILLCLSCFIIGIYFAHSKFFVSEDQEIIRTTVGDFTQGDVIIGAYIDGESYNQIPAKGDGYDVNKVVCDNNAVGTWDSDNWRIIIENLTIKTKCNIYFASKNEYSYTGYEEIFTAYKNGTYKLEVWGAQGGDYSTTYLGGYGGYSIGQIYLNKGDKLYINIGGSGTKTVSSDSDATGGYNGGGRGASRSSYVVSTSGGGTTHIAKSSGLLSTLENNKDSILIVAGGGGGTSYEYGPYSGQGGAGGGYLGNTGTCTNSSYKPGTGGSQSMAGTNGGGNVVNGVNRGDDGAFGQGGNGNYYSAGGGGFYGGGASNQSGGGGGSGYIGNSLLNNKIMYCYNCTESQETATKTVSTTCNEETPTENCAKKGNGYAKITYIEEN